MIRSSKHSILFSNKNKLKKLSSLIEQYRTTLQSIIDFLWNNRIEYKDKYFNVSKNKLQYYSMIDNELLKQFNQFGFTQRLMQCIGKQACSMVSAATEKRRKQLFQLRKLQKESKNIKYLQRKIDLQPLVKPNASYVNLELDSRFFDIKNKNSMFDCFVRIKCLGNSKPFNIPIKNTKVSKKWKSIGRQMNAIRLSSKTLTFCYEIEPNKTKGTRTIGADQGMTTCLALSDGQVTIKNKDGHDLSTILENMTHQSKKNNSSINNAKKRFKSKQSGSKGFKKAQQHRKNYINWSINNLDLSDIKTFKLEKIDRIRDYKRNTQNKHHWAYTIIRDKCKNKCEEMGIKFMEVPSEFKSQRCSRCGLVRKFSRKGKTFSCVCGFTADADVNAASNQEINLYEIPYWVRSRKINREGFYWNAEGIFSKTGECLELLVNNSENIVHH